MSFSKVTFDGYYKVLGYEEDKNIPEYEIGQKLDVKEYIREDKETQPPARYNDGSLIKMLDDIKVGRPSTFATTVSLIKKRLFVTTVNNSLHPTTFGMLVNEKLISGFPETITEEYTAQVEEKLDEISEGKIDYKNLMEEFWNKFNNHLANATETIEISVLPQELVNEKCPNCGSELIYRYTKAKKQKLKEIEDKIFEIEDKIETCNRDIQNPEIFNDKDKFLKLSKDLSELIEEKENLYLEWENYL